MKLTVVPAQVTTIEDKIAGNLTLPQLLILSAPVGMWWISEPTPQKPLTITTSSMTKFLEAPIFRLYECPYGLLRFRCPSQTRGNYFCRLADIGNSRLHHDPDN